MQRMLSSVIAGFVFCLSGIANAQPWLDSPGVTGTMIAGVGNASVRLPPGSWALVGETHHQNSEAATSYVNKLYAQSDNGKIVAIVSLAANETPPPSRSRGFIPLKECYRDDVYFHETLSAHQGNFDCLMVNHHMMDFKSQDSLWAPLVTNAAGLGQMPHPMVYCEFAKSGPTALDYVAVSVFVNPSLSGFTGHRGRWGDSEWQRDNVTPAHRVFLNKVVAWAKAYRPIIAASWE